MIKINTVGDVDIVERYLQALAIATRPIEPVITDLLIVANEHFESDKTKLSIIQTLGSLAYRFGHLPQHSYNNTIVRKVRNYFTSSLNKCNVDPCRELYLNGLRNLQSPETIDQLLEHALHPERSVSVAAMKALRYFPTHVWTTKNIQQFRDIFYQKNKRFDSSARTLALDILLDLWPDKRELQELINHLKSNDKAYEVKKYLLEKITMLTMKFPEFREKLQSILLNDPRINNYHILGPKGLCCIRQILKTN